MNDTYQQVHGWCLTRRLIVPVGTAGDETIRFVVLAERMPDTPIICIAAAGMLRGIITSVEKDGEFMFVLVRGRTTTHAMIRDTFDTGVVWRMLVCDIEVLRGEIPASIQVENEEEEHNRRYDQYSETILSVDGPPPEQTEITFFSSHELEQMGCMNRPPINSGSGSTYIESAGSQTVADGVDYFSPSFNTVEWTESGSSSTINPLLITHPTTSASPGMITDYLDLDDLLDVSTQATN